MQGAVMPTVYDLKPRFQRILRPLVAACAAHGVTANALTVAAIVLSAVYGALLLLTQSKVALLILAPVLLCRMALNAMDGMLAREHGQASLVGAKLNEIGDVIADGCLYLPFAVILSPGWPVVLAVLVGILTEFAGVIALALSGKRRYDGPFGKSDRAVFFTLVAIIEAFRPLSDITVIAVFLAATAAGGMTILHRLSRGADHG
jgi:CDP-diacylglycerol---glycerol-3-phosphate 3-phosphatidyltransferase